MPELKSFPDTKVRDLKDRDLTTYGKVVSVDTKIKWALVTFEGQAGHYTERLPADHTIGCSREVPTEAEKAAKTLENKLQNLDFRNKQACKQARQSREIVAERLAKGQLPSSSLLEELYVRSHEVTVWDRVAHFSRVRAQGDEPVTRLEAVETVKARVMEELLEFARPLSRSTSVSSNWAEDCERQAKLNWLSELRWY